MNATTGTIESRVYYLSTLTTRDHAGRHFTETYPPDVLDDLEAEGLIVITRPVHQATGLSYDQQYWSVEATDEGQDLVDGYPEYQPSPDEAADRTGA